MKKIRLAALQFATGVDTAKNISKTLTMIDKASTYKPDLMVTPEFCNHSSWYQSPEHCFDVSLTLEDEFIKKVADRARQYQCYIVLNITLRDKTPPRCSGSSLLFGRNGDILTISHKQVLMGHENMFLKPGTEPSALGETDFGPIGLYACMDGVIAETPRDLATRGALVLCNSLNSFASDEANLHVPVRAAENKVFVVAANKVGPLIPEDQLDDVSKMIHIPRHYLYGAGESQIVAPDGTVIAKASLHGEEIITADIDPRMALDKKRPSGTDLFKARRPEIYKNLYQESCKKSAPGPLEQRAVRVAIWQGIEELTHPESQVVQGLGEISQKADMLILPQLFWSKKIGLGPASKDLSQEHHGLIEQSSDWIKRLKKALISLPLSVCSSFLIKRPEGVEHVSLLISKGEVVLEQPQLHKTGFFPDDLITGNKLGFYDSAFGRIGLITGGDGAYPELFRCHGFQGVDLVLIPGHLEERWELETGLPERAAENRIALAFATRPSLVGASLFADLEEDFTLMTPWKSRVFDGKINFPRVTLLPRYPGITFHTLNPFRARQKVLSGETHVLKSHPPYFYR
jgi:predicted amidohydrolase